MATEHVDDTWYLGHIVEKLNNLRHQFNGRHALDDNNKQPFIPLRQLQLFWDDQKIQKVINICARFRGSTVIRRDVIKDQFLRLYSLLVFIGEAQQIDQFSKHELEDGVFPLEIFPPQWPDTPMHKHLFALISEYQWGFFPVMFERGRLYSQVLPARRIVPIEHEYVIRPGTEVTLFKASLEGSSAFSTPGRNGKIMVVRKQYHGLRRQDMFERERKAFEVLQSRPCDHIVECLGSFAQVQPDGELSFNLILEHFGFGNLSNFFRTAPPPRNKTQLVNFWRSFRGLFAALHTIHNTSVGEQHGKPRYQIEITDLASVHLDINPRNILMSLGNLDTSRPAVLKIKGFGCSFIQLASDTNRLALSGSQTYGPPECSQHIHWRNKSLNTITPGADIWSAGCVISEAAAWVATGQEGRHLYEEARTVAAENQKSFEFAGHGACFHNGVERLPSVDAMHRWITATLPSYDDITRRVLDLVEESMLVPVEKRAPAWKMRERLGFIIETCAPEETSQSEHLITSPKSEPSHSPPGSNNTRHIASFKMPQTIEDFSNDEPYGDEPLKKRKSPEIPAHLDHSTPSPQPFPFGQADAVSMEEAAQYIRDKKNRNPLDTRVKSVIQQLQDNLAVADRDLVFFVDTSESMSEHRDQVSKILRVCTYMATLIDADGINADGINAGFSTHPEPQRYKTTTALVQSLKEQTWNSDFFEFSFGTFINWVINRLPSHSQDPEFGRPKQQSIFVLTDGQWGTGTSDASGVERPIERLVNAMKAKNLDRTHVAIQFIRFGDEKQGMQLLDGLQDLGGSFDMDIVDTKSFDYDIVATMFGAIEPEVDNTLSSASQSLSLQKEPGFTESEMNSRIAPRFEMQAFKQMESPVNNTASPTSGGHRSHEASEAAPSTWKNSSQLYSSTHPLSIWSTDQSYMNAKQSSASSAMDLPKDLGLALPGSPSVPAPADTDIPEMEDQSLDDVESLLTLEGDIASAFDSSPATASQRSAAVAYLVATFLEDEELVSLYKLASSRLDQARFIRNHRKLLQRFVRDLRAQGASGPSQNLAINFLGRYHTRVAISWAILEKLSEDTELDTVERLKTQEDDRQFLMNLFFSELTHGDRQEQHHLPFNDGLDRHGDSDQASDVDGQDSEDVYKATIALLEQTRDFLCTGPAFQLYKRNIHHLLQPDGNLTAPPKRELSQESTEEPTCPEPETESETPSSGLCPPDKKGLGPRTLIRFKFSRWFLLTVHVFVKPLLGAILNNPVSARLKRRLHHPPVRKTIFLEYRVSSCRPFGEFLQDSCKLWVESLAGGQLSWWPLLQPERPLRKGYTRIYSIPGPQSLRFYDDLETPVAEELFPGLRVRQFSISMQLKKWMRLGHESVHLPGTTLSQRLRIVGNNSSSTLETVEMEPSAVVPRNLDELQEAGDSEPRLGILAQTTTHRPRETPILFLTGQVDRNVTAALAVRLEKDDKRTVESLRAASKRLRNWRWKHATGMRFYRFKSFHMLDSPKRRIVDLHADKERYPESSHGEYPHYTYSPSPWQEGMNCPCSNAELWYFFDKPEFCGTSKRLIESLPVRRGDPDKSCIEAWGVHIEQHYSVFLILLPVLIACIATLGGTFWFISWWLESHPGDLQNATVPAFLAMGVVHFLVNTLVALLLFRWNH